MKRLFAASVRVSAAALIACALLCAASRAQTAGAGDTKPDPAAKNAAQPAVDLTTVYRVGVGDVLDIRLLNAPRTNRSTYHAVLEGGLLEYPLAGKPRVVAGLTTDEIAALLAGTFRLRALFKDPPRLVVSVREYGSHTIGVAGLVEEPGTKVIRREAIPLYVVVADARPRREAGRAVVTCPHKASKTAVDLSDVAATRMHVHAGDAVVLEEKPPQFFQIEGAVKEPGQKDFHTGMTLTQAIIHAGGVRPKGLGQKELARLMGDEAHAARKRAENVAVVLRGDLDGNLTRLLYDLQEIEAGRAPDPVLQAGDKVVVLR